MKLRYSHWQHIKHRNTCFFKWWRSTNLLFANLDESGAKLYSNWCTALEIWIVMHNQECFKHSEAANNTHPYLQSYYTIKFYSYYSWTLWLSIRNSAIWMDQNIPKLNPDKTKFIEFFFTRCGCLSCKSPLYDDLHWLPIIFRIKFKKFMLVFKTTLVIANPGWCTPVL